MALNPELVRGTLETIVLEVVGRRAMYGYEICKFVEQRTKGALELREGSLYPALHKLEKAGLLAARWGESDEGRRRKYYELTPGGAKELARRRAEWHEFTGAVNAIVEGTGVRWGRFPAMRRVVSLVSSCTAALTPVPALCGVR